MYLIDTQWILCPICGSKTRDRFREDKSRLKEHLTHLDEQYLKSLEFPLLISIGVEKRRSL